MKKLFNIIIRVVLSIVLSFLLFVFINTIFIYLLNFDILSYNDWNRILFIERNKLYINTMYTMSIASLVIGFILILFSIVSLFGIYVYGFTPKLLNKFTFLPKNKKQYNRNNSFDKNKLKKIQEINNNKVIKKIESQKSDKIEQAILEDKKTKILSDDKEIALPKSITNSDAYSVIQKMKNNNKNPLTPEQSNDEIKDVRPSKTQDNTNLKHGELRRRILEKFNTSLNEIKTKK